jgi:hypothetical protein
VHCLGKISSKLIDLIFSRNLLQGRKICVEIVWNLGVAEKHLGSGTLQ